MRNNLSLTPNFHRLIFHFRVFLSRRLIKKFAFLFDIINRIINFNSRKKYNLAQGDEESSHTNLIVL
jgi:hypothetical protein